MGALSVWCIGFREIRWIQPERTNRNKIPPPERIVIDRGLRQLVVVLRGLPPVRLPEHRGAGPCGTVLLARPLNGSPLAWSLQELLPALVAYYAALPKRTYPKLGVKHGGGNGRRVLC